MTKVAVVYHSGFGHTAKQAEAVLAGAQSVAGVEGTLLSVNEINDAFWAELAAADAIVFGAPTYMGSASAQFKTFMDASSKVWFKGGWRDKLAGGFTNSASWNGDKSNTLIQLATLAAQHGMIWVSLGLPAANSSKAQRNDLNRLGSFLGAMAQSDSDAGTDVAPPPGDLETAKAYGKRIAEMAQRFKK